MDFFTELSRLIIAMFFAWFFTRIPLVMFPRISIRSLDLVDHPNPPEINESLILQILRIRRAYWASIPFGLVPLVLGIIMLNQSPSSVGFGLIVGSSWVILSRIVPFDLDPMFRFPYSLNLIHELNRIRIESYPCCSSSNPFWALDSVRCSSCSHILLDYPRPDLGRSRIDGWLWGSLRVMILDGHSLSQSNMSNNSEEE